MNHEYAPLDGERLVRGPDGVEYIVRVSGAGAQRSNYYNLIPYLFSEVWRRLRRRTDWQVEVFRLGRIGPEFPAVFHDRMDQGWVAEARGSALEGDIAAGRIGWDRWHAPLPRPMERDHTKP